MSLYTRFASGVLFPLHERLKRHDSVARLRALERSQWWSPEQLKSHQLGSLRRFLVHCRDRVPYYRNLFADHGFDPDGIAGLEDLGGLPLLDKAAIRKHTDELRSETAGALRRYNTGGSSGEPLIFYIGSDRVSHDVAAKWRATRWWGVDIGDPEVVVWGSPIEHGAQDRVRMLRDRLLRSHLLPAFEMSEPALDGFIRDIRRIGPRMLFGYPSALSFIARHARNRGVAMDDLGIKVAFVTSEKLYDNQRRDIQEVFGCPVANGYGGRDAGFLAHECPAGGLHVTAEDIILEVVDRAGRPLPAGESGELVVTHLATSGFPFLRYRTGDVGVMSDHICACGRGLPLLKEVEGRTTDFVVAADGTVMHGLALIYVLRDLPDIDAFKIVQESRALLRVLLVPRETYRDDTDRTIREAFSKRLGEEVQISIEKVEDIPREKSGKFRYVVSKVAA